METIINDVMRMDTGVRLLFYFWAFCVFSFYLTLVYGLGYSIPRKRKKPNE